MSQMAYKADSPSEKGITHLANAPLSTAHRKFVPGEVLIQRLPTLHHVGTHIRWAVLSIP